MRKYKNKNWIKISLLTIFGGLLFINFPYILGDSGFALNTVFAQTADAEKAIKEAIGTIQAVEGMINALLWPMLLMIGGLLDNSLLFGSGMEERMREIWIPIRNMVNILFVVALVGIALYNVLGRADEGGEYALKTFLPKLIVAIIVVNFSFLGIKVFLDAVNVLTVSIFSLPDQMNFEMQSSIVGTPKEQRYCAVSQGQAYDKIDVNTQPHTNHNDLMQTQFERFQELARLDLGTEADETAIENKAKEYQADAMCNGFELTEQGKRFFSTYGTNNAALLFVLGLGNIVFYDDVPIDGENIEKLFTSSLFSVLLYIVYAVSFMALFLVLLARLVVMWLSVVLSPVLLLSMTVPAAGEKMELFKKVSDSFMKHAIAPIGIAISMTVGWIMLNSMKGAQTLSVTGYKSNVVPSLISGSMQGFPIVGLNTMQDIIVEVGVIAVVWLGVFTAASQTIAAPVTEWMKGTLLGVGKWIARAPLYYARAIPVKVPGGTPKRMTPAEIGQRVEQMLRPPVVSGAVKSITEVRNKLDLINYLKYELRNDARGTVANWVNSNKSTPAYTGLTPQLRTKIEAFIAPDSTLQASDVSALAASEPTSP